MAKVNPIWIIFIIAVVGVSIYTLLQRKNDQDVTTVTRSTDFTYDKSYDNIDSGALEDSPWSDSILIFQSSFYDIEKNGDIVETITRNSVHIFDFHEKIITRKVLKNGNWVVAKYAMNSFYKQTGLVSTTYVFTIKDNLIKEIWFCPFVPNLGYDYLDGSRMAFYNVSQVD